MRLVVKSAYASTMRWGSASLEFCPTAPGTAVQAGTVTTACTAFQMSTLETDRLVLTNRPTDAVVNDGTVAAVTCTECTDDGVFFLGPSTITTGVTIGVQQVTDTLWRYMKAPANNHCTLNEDGFVQSDCDGKADPLKMTLVVNAPYESGALWGEAQLVATTGSSVAANRIVVNGATFRIAKADTPMLVLNTRPTDGVISSGKVTAVTCESCVDDRCLLRWRFIV